MYYGGWNPYRGFRVGAIDSLPGASELIARGMSPVDAMKELYSRVPQMPQGAPPVAVPLPGQVPRPQPPLTAPVPDQVPRPRFPGASLPGGGPAAPPAAAQRAVILTPSGVYVRTRPSIYAEIVSDVPASGFVTVLETNVRGQDPSPQVTPLLWWRVMTAEGKTGFARAGTPQEPFLRLLNGASSVGAIDSRTLALPIYAMLWLRPDVKDLISSAWNSGSAIRGLMQLLFSAGERQISAEPASAPAPPAPPSSRFSQLLEILKQRASGLLSLGK